MPRLRRSWAPAPSKSHDLRPPQYRRGGSTCDEHTAPVACPRREQHGAAAPEPQLEAPSCSPERYSNDNSQPRGSRRPYFPCISSCRPRSVRRGRGWRYHRCRRRCHCRRTGWGRRGWGRGAIVGGLADEQRPRFRQHVVQQRPPSHRYQQEVQVGAVLPSSGVTYYEVPAEYGVRDYRYTVVNDRTVLVDPRTHRVIQIID